MTYKITVHNTGAAPEDIFLDPRLTTLRSYPLQPQDRVAGVRLPLPATVNPPEWIVPTMTQQRVRVGGLARPGHVRLRAVPR